MSAQLPAIVPVPKEEEEGLKGMGGRKELERLMAMYKVKIPVPGQVDHVAKGLESESLEEDSDEEAAEDERQMREAIRKRMVNVAKIEKVVQKGPFERRPDEIEAVRKEVAKMEVFRKIQVSPAAERDICKFARLRKYKPGEYVFKQGEIGDAFYIILEGMCNVEHSVMGLINQLFASDTFGEIALLQDGAVRKASIVCDQPCKMLEIKKPEFNRYIKPFHKEEQAKRDNLLKAITVFEHLSHEQSLNLMGGMRTHRYRTGDTVIREGKYNRYLMFLVTGHVSVSKKATLLKMDTSTDLPNPLATAARRNEAPGSGLVEVNLGMLYKGRVIDPESVLTRQKSAYTATAMSQVEVLAVDTITHIFVDSPVIDSETLQTIRRINNIVPDKKTLVKMAKNQLNWKGYRDHLVSHVVYKHRKDQATKAGPFSVKETTTKKDDLAYQGALDNPPELEAKTLVDRVEPTDGRWPFCQPNIYRSDVVNSLLGLTPINIMLKDKTIF
uniref:Cyclic nucleotide-binding domain-containing protein n=1 Tax=Hemiselmis andersenii TaxID=464988 RepID=A0A6U4W0S5_HEMAN|mmetsp:Transcript_7212/g.16532  ORF Transcript_7212/g.16532 Transcript_7212/m.16532 type:complete len:499 (+) Transcript_7212:67-1563(+)